MDQFHSEEETWKAVSGSAREFSLLGRILRISEEQDAYNTHRKMYMDCAYGYAQDLNTECIRQISDFDTFIQLYIDLYKDYLAKMIKNTNDILVSYGVWTETSGSILARHIGKYHLAVDSYISTLSSALGSSKQFDISELIADGGVSSHETDDLSFEQKNEAYAGINLDDLTQRVFSDYWHAFDTLIGILLENGISIWAPSDEESVKADNIMKNTSNPNFPQEQFPDAMISVIGMDPYKASIYDLLLSRNADENEVESIRDYFGIDVKKPETAEVIVPEETPFPEDDEAEQTDDIQSGTTDLTNSVIAGGTIELRHYEEEPVSEILPDEESFYTSFVDDKPMTEVNNVIEEHDLDEESFYKSYNGPAAEENFEEEYPKPAESERKVKKKSNKAAVIAGVFAGIVILLIGLSVFAVKYFDVDITDLFGNNTSTRDRHRDRDRDDDDDETDETDHDRLSGLLSLITTSTPTPMPSMPSETSLPTLTPTPLPTMTPTPTMPPDLVVISPEPIDYLVTDITASSIDNESSGNYYYPYEIMDDDLNTCWAEGVDGNGIGEYIDIHIPEGTVISGIMIHTGYCKSDSVFSRNGAPSVIDVYSGEQGYRLDLNSSGSGYAASDYGVSSAGVYVSFPAAIVSNGNLRITIADVRDGTDWDDVCFSEIELWGTSNYDNVEYVPGDGDWSNNIPEYRLAN